MDEGDAQKEIELTKHLVDKLFLYWKKSHLAIVPSMCLLLRILFVIVYLLCSGGRSCQADQAMAWPILDLSSLNIHIIINCL